MKKSIKLFAVVALIAATALVISACSGGNNPTNTPGKTPETTVRPSVSPNASVKPSGSPAVGGTSESPGISTSPEASGAPLTSGSPDVSTSPGQDANKGGIEGFTEGKVIDQKDAPDVVKNVISNFFSGMTIQSITHDKYESRQAYKVTLQGEGELAKNFFVFPDGSVIIPAMGD